MRRLSIGRRRHLCVALVAAIVASAAPVLAAEVGDYKFSFKQRDHNSDAGHWLLLNGRTLSKTNERGLFDVFGYALGGAGDNFNLPDARGRTLVFENNTSIAGGADDELPTRNAGDRFGAETATLSVDDLPAHKHGAGSYSTSRSDGTAEVFTGGQGEDDEHSQIDFFLLHRSGTAAQTAWRSNVIRHSGSGGAAVSGASGSTGKDSAVNISPPSVVLGSIFVLADTEER